MKILVSACLLGVCCKYSGGSNNNAGAVELPNKHLVIPVCPEQLGGLGTPRPPSEICGERVITAEGADVTENFLRGAEETLRLCRIYGCTHAVLKERSPSCGTKYVYDGSFSKTLRKGLGITAALLKKNGVLLYSEEETDELL